MVIGKKPLLAALIIAALAPPESPLLPTAAHAQAEGDAKRKALAIRLIAAGDTLLEEGDYFRKKKKEQKAVAKFEKALKAYEEAYDRFPSPKIFYLIGLAENRLGRHLDAIRHFKQLIQEAEDASDELKAQVELSIDEAKQYVVTLMLIVEPEGALVSIDGEDIGEAPLTEPFFVAPGEHTIAASAEGHVPFETVVTVEAGVESERTISLEKIPVVVKKPRPKPIKEKKAPTVNKMPLIALISTTGGMAALAMITGLAAVSKHGTFSDDSLDADKREAARKSGKKLALITDLLWLGTAAVGAYTAYYYYGVHKPKKRSHERRMRLKGKPETRRIWVTPYASARGGGVAVGGAF